MTEDCREGGCCQLMVLPNLHHLMGVRKGGARRIKYTHKKEKRCATRRKQDSHGGLRGATPSLHRYPAALPFRSLGRNTKGCSVDLLLSFLAF